MSDVESKSSNHKSNRTGPRRDWDIDAAFERLAPGDTERFKTRLAEEGERAGAGEIKHLSFDDIQLAHSETVILSAVQKSHVRECSFCRELIDALTPGDEEREQFVALLKLTHFGFEEGQGLARAQLEPTVASVRVESENGRSAFSPAQMRSRSVSDERQRSMAFGILAMLVIAVSMLVFLTRPSGVLLTASTSVDLQKTTKFCILESEKVEGCDGLVASFALVTSGHERVARPVFVRGLEDAGFHTTTVAYVKTALSIDGNHTTEAIQQLFAEKLRHGNYPPSYTLLVAAARDISSGRTLLGYEQLGQFATAQESVSPDATRALEVGFLDPIRKIQNPLESVEIAKK